MSNDTLSVIQSLSLVMEDVQAVGKGDRNQQQGYMFRGVDAVVNAVGPALRKHGVVVVPIGAVVESEHYVTKSGTPMKGVTATVTFRFYGPAGDHIDAQACGESSDSGDKAVPKAHSVAFRTMLLQALCIPTNEADPDSEAHERGTAPAAPAATPKPAAAFVSPVPPVDPHGFAESRADAPDDGGDPARVVLTFGKWSGKRINEVPTEYLQWWVSQDEPKTADMRRQRAAALSFLALPAVESGAQS